MLLSGNAELLSVENADDRGGCAYLYACTAHLLLLLSPLL
jgi:hypothetical protein